LTPLKRDTLDRASVRRRIGEGRHVIRHRGWLVALAVIIAAAAAAAAGCRAAASPPPRPTRATAMPPVPVPAWCTPVLARADVASAALDAAPADTATAPESTAATAAIVAALRAYAADHRPSAHHAVVPSLVDSATIGSVCVLVDPTPCTDEVGEPVWDTCGVYSQVRVGLYSGQRFMGEFVVFADEHGPMDPMLVDGTYSIAQRAALVLLWDRLGRAPFEYRVASDGESGSWVIGRAHGRTVGVYLGDCRADQSGDSIDGRGSKVVKPGVVMDEKAMSAAMARIRQASPTGDSMYY
jgi:hypothetical protein